MPDFNSKTWSANEAVTSSQFNTYVRDNLEAIRAPARVWNNISSTTNITTSSTSFGNVGSDFQLDITPNIASGLTCDILVVASFSLRCSNNATVYEVTHDLTVNGTSVSGGRGVSGAKGNNLQTYPVSIQWLLTAQDNTLKTIRLRWKVSNAAATAIMVLNAATVDSCQPQFYARVM
jgi:hypothetical protein